MIWKKEGDDAVSEVVGNLLILVITVALFSVVLGFVYQIPGPEASIQADVVPMLERTSAVDGTLHLQHTGGEPLREGETYILVSIDDTPQEFKISDGLGGKTVMEPGDTWSMDFLGTVSTSAKIDVKIVDRTSNSLLFYTVNITRPDINLIAVIRIHIKIFRPVQRTGIVYHLPAFSSICRTVQSCTVIDKLFILAFGCY